MSATSGLRLAPRPPARDPAWLPRLFWTSAALVLLWPLAVATEFRPWVLLEPGNLKISAQFSAAYLFKVTRYFQKTYPWN